MLKTKKKSPPDAAVTPAAAPIREPIYVPAAPGMGKQQAVVAVRSPVKYQLAILGLLFVLAYVVFTVASMVPPARQHFIDLLLAPNFSLFLAR